MKYKAVLFFLLIMGLTIGLATSAMAATIYVDSAVFAVGNGGAGGTGLTTALTGVHRACATVSAGITAAGVSGIVIVEPSATAYAEDITPLATQTIKKGTGGTGTVVTISGSAANTGVVIININGVVLQGLTITDTLKAGAATDMITVVGANTSTTFRDCSFVLAATPSTMANVISYGAAASGVTVENCSFDMTGLTVATKHNGIVFVTGAVSNVDIYGCTFTDVFTHATSNSVFIKNAVTTAGIDEFDFTGNTCTWASLTMNFSNIAVAAGGTGNTRINGNVFQGGNGVIFQTVAPADDATFVMGVTNENAHAVLPVTGKTIIIKGNHFGSASTNGDAKYGVYFHGFEDATAIQANITIQFNNLQYPQTGGAQSDGNTGHISWVNSTDVGVTTLAARQIDATNNWYGSISGPIGSFASGAIAVLGGNQFIGNLSGEFIASYGVPALDEQTHGVEFYDFDNNGFLDRAEVWFNYYVDPATVTSANFSVAGYTIDAAKPARLGMDNDRSGATDGPFAMTLFLTEGSVMDTGVTPTLTYTSPASEGIRGITGNSSAKVLSFTASSALSNVHDKAFPIVKTVTTGDADMNGKLDRLVVVYSEPMKALASGVWITGFTGGAGTFKLNYMYPVASTIGYTATSASQVGDTVTYVLTETTVATDLYDTGNTPTFTYTSNNSVMDLSLNQIPTFSAVATDGAPPIAIRVGTEDVSNTGAGVPPNATADGYLDGVSIYFSEAVTPQLYTSGDYNTSYKVLKDLSFAAVIKNSINIPLQKTADVLNTTVVASQSQTMGAGTALIATSLTSNRVKILGYSGKEVAQTSLTPWNTSATPTLVFANTADGIKDAAGNVWTVFSGNVGSMVSTDTAAPIITEAFGNVGTTQAYITFSEPVYSDNAHASITDASLGSDMTYTNTNAGGSTGFAATTPVTDGDASDYRIQLKVNAAFVAADADGSGTADRINAQASALQDITGSVPNATQGNFVTTTVVPFSLYDVVPPFVTLIQTEDFDADGQIDHLKVTFDGSINDAVLTGYNGTDKLAPAVNWTVAGYTVVGINFVSSYAEQTTATADAAVNFPNAAKDSRGRIVWPITTPDVDNDNIIYLMVQEKTTGDTAAKPTVSIAGAAGSVKDLKMNVLATQTALPSLDYAGPAITSAAMVSTTTNSTVMDVTFSEPLNALQTFSQPGGASVGGIQFKGKFSFLVGTNENIYDSDVRDATLLTPGGTTWRVTTDWGIPAGTTAKVAVANVTVGNGVQDAVVYAADQQWNGLAGTPSKYQQIPNYNTQNATQTTNLYTAATGVDTGTGVAGYITVGILPATTTPTSTVTKVVANQVASNLAISNKNVTRVYVSGAAAAADSVVVKLVDNTGAEAMTTLVANAVGNFMGQIDASSLANGVVTIKAGKTVGGVVSAWFTGADYMKETITVGAPAALVVTDVPGDQGGFVDLTFTKSANDVANPSDFYAVDYYVLQGKKGGIWYTLNTFLPDGNTDTTYRALGVWVGTEAISDTLRINAHVKLNGASKVADAPDAMSSAYALGTGTAIDNILPGAFVSFAVDGSLGTGVDSKWVAPADHGLYNAKYNIWGVDGYEVYRRVVGTTDYTKVGTVAPGVSEFLDTTVANGSTVYEYMVKAVDGSQFVVTSISKAMASKGYDFNGDNTISVGDLALLGHHWNQTSSDPNFLVNFDLSKDGKIGVGDLALLGQHWGKASKVAKAAGAVPVSNVAFQMVSTAGKDNSMYFVSINTQNVADIKGVSFDLSYDASKFEFVPESVTGLSEIQIVKPDQGIISIASVYNSDAFSGTITLGFKAKGMNSVMNVEMVSAAVMINDVESAVNNAAGVTLKALPSTYALSQNFPNPFNPTTTIEYSIPTAGNVSLVVYNVAGQKVRTLVNNSQAASFYKVVWDGKNDNGLTVGTGTYFYKLVSGNYSKIVKMTLMK